jgi:hypothetical protein
MPKIEHWDNLPEGVRQHLIDRMRSRLVSQEASYFDGVARSQDCFYKQNH